MPNEFDSHAFISSYMTLYERNYVEMLYEKINTNGIFRTVNSMIAMFIDNNHMEFGVDKYDRHNSPNVRCNITENQNWRKTK